MHPATPKHSLTRWLFTTNHKDIGTLYLWFSFMMFLFGGSMAMCIRAELFKPGLQFFEPAFFNQLTTMHGLVMIFGAVILFTFCVFPRTCWCWLAVANSFNHNIQEQQLRTAKNKTADAGNTIKISKF